ncbi:MAG: hypothetical protein K2X55_07560 [Burkholderiaceae bacterium]|nr:hypothetical protein [Burkholderiaceae bacterium]
MTLDQAMSIYAEAIVPTTPAAGGRGWWLQVHKEVEADVAATSNAAAAGIIDWWHYTGARLVTAPREQQAVFEKLLQRF